MPFLLDQSVCYIPMNMRRDPIPTESILATIHMQRIVVDRAFCYLGTDFAHDSKTRRVITQNGFWHPSMRNKSQHIQKSSCACVVRYFWMNYPRARAAKQCYPPLLLCDFFAVQWFTPSYFLLIYSFIYPYYPCLSLLK